MTKAIWNGVVVAESDRCEVVENNYYFPADSIRSEFFRPSSYQTSCPWKGLASYYNLQVEGKTNENAAWYYPETKEKANNIKGYIAFWKGVEVQK